MRKPPQRDPIQGYQRRATAARRVGKDKKCSCGEKRPEALISSSNPVICAACKRKKEGKTTMDDHHVFGKANDPTTTVIVPVNDHRAELSVAQQDWPKKTLENPDGSPLLSAAARIRGFVDYVIYLIEKGLLWVARMLEALDEFLESTLGVKWWCGTPLAQFVPRN
jgi:hypothetical protein